MRYLLNKDWGVIERKLVELRAAGFGETKERPIPFQFRVRQSSITKVWKLEFEDPRQHIARASGELAL